MRFYDNINNLCLEIDKDVFTAIREQVSEHFPNETGGFLVGKYSNDSMKALVLQNLLPPKIASSPTSFQRETDGMEPIWNQLYKEGLFYIGEWHSHPNGKPDYSTIDKKALTNIAMCDNVVIKRPVMLIIGITEKGCIQLKAYYYDNGNIIEYEQD